MTTASPIAAALEQLELERANLAARLDKVDALIASMRDVFHLPRGPRLNGHAHAKVEKAARPAKNGHGSISTDAIRAALRRGPMSPGALAAALQVPRARLGYHVTKLEEQGVLTTSGTTASRRIALADRPAKEDP